MIRRRQRGATVIEYAFLTALLVIPLVEVSEVIRDQQGENIEASGDRVGTPTEYSSYVDPGSPPPTFDTGDGGSGTTGIETFVTLDSTGKKKGKRWTATATIAASDVNGSVSGGVFEGTWEVFDATGTLDRTINASCTIDTKGNCTLSLANLDFGTADKDETATFTITALISDDLVAADGVVGTTTSVVKSGL